MASFPFFGRYSTDLESRKGEGTRQRRAEVKPERPGSPPEDREPHSEAHWHLLGHRLLKVQPCI